MASRGRPKGAPNKDKPWRAALVRALGRNPKVLDEMADQLLEDCTHEDEITRSHARKELADRLDGRPPQQMEADVNANVDGVLQVIWVKPDEDAEG